MRKKQINISTGDRIFYLFVDVVMFLILLMVIYGIFFSLRDNSPFSVATLITNGFGHVDMV